MNNQLESPFSFFESEEEYKEVMTDLERQKNKVFFKQKHPILNALATVVSVIGLIQRISSPTTYLSLWEHDAPIHLHYIYFLPIQAILKHNYKI